jgi:hypothetical protein
MILARLRTIWRPVLTAVMAFAITVTMVVAGLHTLSAPPAPAGHTVQVGGGPVNAFGYYSACINRTDGVLSIRYYHPELPCAAHQIPVAIPAGPVCPNEGETWKRYIYPDQLMGSRCVIEPPENTGG